MTVLRSRRGRYSGLALLFGVAVVALLVSPVGSARTHVVPSNTVEPAITGTAAVGQTLTTSDGTWSGSPTSFTYQWVRCPVSGGQPDGSDCAVIGGATTNNYAPATGDVKPAQRIDQGWLPGPRAAREVGVRLPEALTAGRSLVQ